VRTLPAHAAQVRSIDRGHLLHIVAHVCRETLSTLNEQLCSLTINLAVNEMTMSKVGVTTVRMCTRCVGG
jgi:hypothetical protein